MCKSVTVKVEPLKESVALEHPKTPTPSGTFVMLKSGQESAWQYTASLANKGSTVTAVFPFSVAWHVSVGNGDDDPLLYPASHANVHC